MAAELPETLIGLNLGPPEACGCGRGRFWFLSRLIRISTIMIHARGPLGWWGFSSRMAMCKNPLDVCISKVTPIELWIICWTQKTKEGRTPVIWQDLQCVQDWVYMSSAYKSGAWLLESGIFLIYFDTGWKKSWIDYILCIWSRAFDRFHLVELDF